MLSHSLVPFFPSFASLLSQFAAAGAVSPALEAYRCMISLGYSPNVFVNNGWDGGSRVWGFGIDGEEKGDLPDVVTYSAIVNGLCKGGRLDDAVVLFREMEDMETQPNHVTYTPL
ncbi:Pentatricopeptide repeat-containing protein [Drosera capensis]